MNTKKFKTLVCKGANDYILGRISGMKLVICDDPGRVGYANMKTKYGTILTTRCSMAQYTLFMNMVEEKYPDLCIFNYEP